MHISINFAYAGFVAGLILTHHLTASTPTTPLLSAVLSRAYNKAFFPGFHGPSCGSHARVWTLVSLGLLAFELLALRPP